MGDAAAEDDLTHAARLWGVAEAIAESTEVLAYAYALDRSLHRSYLVDPGPAREGRAMTAGQAVAEALSKDG